MLQVLLRMAADPRLAEDALVDLLMDVLADETPCPLSEKESCELVAVYRVFTQRAVSYQAGIATLEGGLPVIRENGRHTLCETNIN